MHPNQKNENRNLGYLYPLPLEVLRFDNTAFVNERKAHFSDLTDVQWQGLSPRLLP